MERKYLYIILFLLFSVSLHGQKRDRQAIDSMLKDLGTDRFAKNDSNKVKQLIRISWAYADNNNPNESIKYAQQGLELALKVNYKKGIQRAYEIIAENYMAKWDHPKALEYYAKAMNTAEEMSDKEAIATATGNIARVYYQMGDFKKSLENDFKSLKINEENGYKSNMAHDLNNIGKCYVKEGYYPKALEYHLKALKIFEQLGEKKSIATSYINIANVFLFENDYNKALENFNQALKLYEKIENKVGIAYCYTSIGSVYQLRKEPVKSLEYFQKALKITNEIEDKDLTGNLTASIGIIYYNQHKYTDAIGYFQASLKIFNEIGDRKSIPNSLTLLGDCFVAIIKAGSALSYSNRAITTSPEIQKYLPAINIPSGKAALLNAAFENYKKSLGLSREINARQLSQRSYEGLTEAYKLSNDYKKALIYADSAQVIKDSLFSKENNEKIVRMEVKNEYDNQHFADSLKHEQDIQAANFKLQKQRFALYISLGIFILIIITIIILQRAKTARIKSEQQAIFSRQLLEIELKALRAQMNPHFIFNSLNSIQAFILKENKTEAADYLQKFSKLIRMILDNSQKTSNTIEEEAEILSLYMDLEKLRLKNKFDFEIKISGDLDPTFTEIPSMVLQPLVENSIWHGLMNSTQKGALKIEFIKEKNKLICMVEDNGIGRNRSKELKDENRKSHESKGIKLIEARLRAWSQEKGLQYTFKISDNPEQGTGTRTEITILYPPYA